MIFRIIFKTLPYFLLRLVAHLLFGLIILIFLGLMGGLGYLVARFFKEATIPLIVIGIVVILGLWGLVRLAERYVLYLIKAGHVTVVTELVNRGELPAGINQISYGKDKVVRHFGTTSVLFVVDQLVSGSVRQILRWLTRMAGLFASIPGVRQIVSLLKAILGLAANYIDEAVLSYIVSHEEKSVWQAAADGVVLYAQSWKKILTTAAVFVLLLIVGWVVAFLLFLTPLLGVARILAPTDELRLLYGFVALVAAFVLANVVKWILVDPLATVAMIVSYNQAIQGVTPSYDLHSQLSLISGKFRRLSERARQESSGGPI